MSAIPPDFNQTLKFYLSGPAPCPYLPHRVERKLFTHLPPDQRLAYEVNGALCRAGFRRSHGVAYRPACPSCNACVPVRLPVRLFQPSRTQRRMTTRNRDLTTDTFPARANDELYALFIAYERNRHADSDMAQMSYDDFKAMLEEGGDSAQITTLRDDEERLLGAILTDRLNDGVSPVYSFFTPDQPKRSLGTQMVLTLIEAMRDAKQPYVYLGYWIAEARVMTYKARFQPLQALTSQGWDWLAPTNLTAVGDDSSIPS